MPNICYATKTNKETVSSLRELTVWQQVEGTVIEEQRTKTHRETRLTLLIIKIVIKMDLLVLLGVYFVLGKSEYTKT